MPPPVPATPLKNSNRPANVSSTQSECFLHETAMNIEINVRLYGSLKKYAPGDQTDFMLVLEPGTTLGDVLCKLSIPEDSHVALVNGRRIANDVQFENGITLVLFPPVSGG